MLVVNWTRPQFLQDSWAYHLNRPLTLPDLQGRTLQDLERSEWSAEFERYMRNRMLQGAFRYGLLGAPNKPQFDRIACVKRRLDQYLASGNTEFLVDSANLLMLEYVEGEHPNKHFASIDDGRHTDAK